MSEPITSLQNTRVAAARRLLQTRTRAAAAAFLAEGPHAVGEALTSGRHAVDELFVTPAAAERDVELMRVAAAGDVRVTLVSDRVAASISDTVTPQGIVAVVRVLRPDLASVLATRPRLLAILAGVGDPGNAGTVIRTADAVGADAVVATAGSVDPYGPKCVRASAGSLFHLPVVRDDDTDGVLAAVRAEGVLVVATTLAADADAISSPQVRTRLATPTAWVFGNEAHGVPDRVAAAADLRVRIPLHGQAESLNLAAAAAICLYTSADVQRGR